MLRDARFPNGSRLTAPAEFAAVFQNRRARHGMWLTVKLRVDTDVPGKELLMPRLGLIVAKKFLRRAIDRNRVKRLMRETFRNSQHNLAPGDWVIRLNAKPAPQILQSPALAFREEAERFMRELTNGDPVKSPQ